VQFYFGILQLKFNPRCLNLVQMYPDLWGQQNNAWIDAWVAGHSANGITWNKPVIVKEQGMQPTKDRTIFYAAMYSSDFAQIVADRTQSGGLKASRHASQDYLVHLKLLCLWIITYYPLILMNAGRCVLGDLCSRHQGRVLDPGRRWSLGHLQG